MEVNKKLIQDYHEGNCNEAERQAVENWLKQADSEISFPNDLDMDVLQEKSWEVFQEKQRKTLQTIKKRVHMPQVYAGIAAGILLLVGFTYMMQAMLVSKPVYHTLEVPAGKKVTVTLSDGSQVHLNSGSTLQYPKPFGKDYRKVLLHGEAYFDIASDTKRPFIVETPRSLTKVLGTSFNLRDFANEESSSVVVEEGKVQFGGRAESNTLVLSAGTGNLEAIIFKKKVG